MKISHEWLQTYFEKPLPDAGKLADALTFHAFEIESVENDILDVKVTANRGHDCLSHRGIAKEISAILEIPMKEDPLREPITLSPKTDTLSLALQRTVLCKRYVVGYMRKVGVGPSPEWLRRRLEALGERSVNNVVDATNYVMFDLGQPLHAFDAGKLALRDGKYAIAVRLAREGEVMLALDEKEYALSQADLLIVDGNADTGIGIAGVKGGMPSRITEATTDIIIESANFDGPSIRKTAQRLKLRTEASARFEQVISPELAAYGMRAVVELIKNIAGGEIVGYADEYPAPVPPPADISVSAKDVNDLLGTSLDEKTMADALRRLGLTTDEVTPHRLSVRVPFERLDLLAPEDLIEEIGRIEGYDKVPEVELPELPQAPVVNANFYAAERERERLSSKGYSEVYTSVFVDEGERAVAGKVDGARPYLRSTLVNGLADALMKNIRNQNLLGLEEVKLFEIGTVWKEGNEYTMVGIADDVQGVREERLTPAMPARAYDELSVSTTERYEPFSKYPFVVRDIALWVSEGADASEVLEVIRTHAGELLVRSDTFDEFKKDGRVSYAFRLVFQSFDRTLTDFDVNERMGSVEKALAGRGWQVR